MAGRLARAAGRWDALALAAAIWFLAKLLRYAFPPLFGTFQSTFGVSSAVLGGTFSAMMLCYAALQFPSGALADRVGPVRVVAAGAVVAASGAVVVFAAGGFPALAAGMVLVGVGTGAHKTVSVALLPAIYDRRSGRVLGAFDTAGTFGGVAAPAAVVALAGTAAGWPALFLAAGVAGFALAALFVARLSRRAPGTRTASGDGGAADASPAAESDGAGLRRYVALFADRRFRAFVGVTVLFSFAYNGAVAFLPLYLTDAVGLDPATASLVYGALFAVSLVQPLAGEASDRVGRLPVAAGAAGAAAIGLVGLLVATTPAVAVAAVLVLGAGSHGFRPVRGAHLYALVPDALAGGSVGVVRTAIMGAGAVAPAAVGVLAEWANFRVAFGLLAVSLVAALVVVVALLVTRDAGTE